MQVKTLLTGIVAFTAGIVCLSGSAFATAYSSNGAGGGFWDVSTSWSPNGLPVATDTVTVLSGDTITIRSTATPQAIASMTVTGSVVINASSRLNLAGTATSTLNSGGNITLAGSNAVLGVLAIHTMSGPGKIIGQHNAAKIEISRGLRPQDDITFNNKSVVEGQMLIQRGSGLGTATFVNFRDDSNGTPTTGVVHANVAGTLEFDANLILKDQAYGPTGDLPLWLADTNSSAVLKFDGLSDGSSAAHPVLVGNFDVDDCATQMFLQNFYTNGAFPFTQGYVNVYTNSSVCFTYDYSGSPTSICNDTDTCP